MGLSFKTDLINELQTVLNSHNEYISSFKYNLETNSFKENFKLIIHADRTPQNQYQGKYNSPTTNEVVVLLVNEDKEPRDIILHCKDGLSYVFNRIIKKKFHPEKDRAASIK